MVFGANAQCISAGCDERQALEHHLEQCDNAMQELRENTNRLHTLQHQMQSVMAMFANFASNQNGCHTMQTDEALSEKQTESTGTTGCHNKA
eukprot:m.254994 g.254994  ORF g.254994 m.254994 type:complete len:92 (+) comp19608_c0_seq13:893-1168(+)